MKTTVLYGMGGIVWMGLGVEPLEKQARSPLALGYAGRYRDSFTCEVSL